MGMDGSVGGGGMMMGTGGGGVGAGAAGMGGSVMSNGMGMQSMANLPSCAQVLLHALTVPRRLFPFILLTAPLWFCFCFFVFPLSRSVHGPDFRQVHQRAAQEVASAVLCVRPVLQPVSQRPYVSLSPVPCAEGT